MIKVIQAGMGGMGNVWLRTVLDSPEVEFAGFVEIDEDIAAKQVAAHGLDGDRVFKSLAEALDSVKADGVIDVTPPQFHRENSLTALEAGIPVLSEKPLANSRPAALAIVEKANQTGVLHMVTQNYRYRSAIQTLKQALHTHGLGAIGSATVDFFRGPLWRLSRGDGLSPHHRYVHPSLRCHALFPGERPGGRLRAQLESALELVSGRCLGSGDPELRRRSDGRLQRLLVLTGAHGKLER